MKKFNCKCGKILKLPENRNNFSFKCPNCKRIYKPKKNPELLKSDEVSIIEAETWKRDDPQGIDDADWEEIGEYKQLASGEWIYVPPKPRSEMSKRNERIFNNALAWGCAGLIFGFFMLAKLTGGNVVTSTDHFAGATAGAIGGAIAGAIYTLFKNKK